MYVYVLYTMGQLIMACLSKYFSLKKNLIADKIN